MENCFQSQFWHSQIPILGANVWTKHVLGYIHRMTFWGRDGTAKHFVYKRYVNCYSIWVWSRLHRCVWRMQRTQIDWNCWNREIHIQLQHIATRFWSVQKWQHWHTIKCIEIDCFRQSQNISKICLLEHISYVKCVLYEM